MNFSQRKQGSVLKKLFERECIVQPSATQIHTARSFYKIITPNTEVQLQDDEQMEVCAFSLCGKYLVCRGKMGHSVEVFRSDSLPSIFLNAESSSCKFPDFFQHVGSIALPLGEVLSKDLLFFIEGTEMLIICTHGQLFAEEDDEYQGFLFGTCAVSTVCMESPVRLLDTFRHHEDNFFCFDQCVSLFERQMLIHSQRNNAIILLRISTEGNFEILKKIGINSPTLQQQQLLQEFYGNDEQNYIPVDVHKNYMAGFRQKLVTYLYLKALISESQGQWSHENFCSNFDRLQLIQIKCCHLLGVDTGLIVVRLGVDFTMALEDVGSVCTVVYDFSQDTIKCAFLEGDDLEQELAYEAQYLLSSTQHQHSLWIISAIHNHVANLADSKKLRVSPECQFRGQLQSSPYLDKSLFTCCCEGEIWKWKFIQNDELRESVRFYSRSPKPSFCLGGYSTLQNVQQEQLTDGVWIRRIFHPVLPLVLTLIVASRNNPETHMTEVKVLAYHK